ncbi:MAG: hypothetical protein ACFE9C_15020 [Candidatus Hodarchaeota archaeon]
MKRWLYNQSEMVISTVTFRAGVVLTLVFLMVGCNSMADQVSPKPEPSSTPTLLPSPSPPPAPTLTPVPASDYELGIVDISNGFLLLLSNYTWRVCTKECDCPEVEGLRRGYNIKDDRLYLSIYGMDQSWEEGSLPAIAYALGDFEEALVAIEKLPYSRQGDFPILAALEDGTIVFEWDGNAYQLATGES